MLAAGATCGKLTTKTVSESQVEKVRKYVQNQEIHHQTENFTDEYKKFLTANRIDFDDKYLWS